jgi:hypothetical protein
MRTIRFLLFLLLSFTLTGAWADVLPRPRGEKPPRPRDWQGPSPPTPVGPQTTVKETRVSMAAANVQVRIKKEAAAPGAGEKTSRLVAQVTGEFDLVCSAGPQEGKDLDVVFPIAYEGERPAAPVSFAVTIDGKPGTNVKTDTWSVTDENKRPRTQWGYAWRLTGLKDGQKRRIAVEYSFVLPQKKGKAQFIYFLRSGALWDGPIGREVVNVTADKGLRMEVLSPAAFKPEQRSDTALTWRITNAKPAEDIRLTIVPSAQP